MARFKLENFMNNKKLFVALTLAGTCGLGAQATQIGTLLSEWNVVTSGNLTGVTDVQGNVYVGGNYTVANSTDIGTSDSNVMPAGNVSLAVAGNFSTGNPSHVNAGNAVVGGTVTGTINMNSGGTLTHGNPAALPSSPVAAITSASLYWSTLGANSSFSTANNQINFVCNNNQNVAVFNLTASQLFAQNQSLSLTAAAITKNIIINVSGISVAEFNSENFLGAFTSWGSKVVFNFYQATTVSLPGSSLYGYIVAPGAAVTANSPIVGGVMASTLSTSSEVELSGTPCYSDLPDVPTTTPNVPAVPDASATALLLGIALSGAAALRHKLTR